MSNIKTAWMVIGRYILGYILWMAPMIVYCMWQHPDMIGIEFEIASIGYITLAMVEIGSVIVNMIRANLKIKKEMEP